MSITEDLVRDEGMELKAYKCPAGYITIGVGRNLESNGITASEAMTLLEHDIQRCRHELFEQLPVYSKLDDVRKDVLVNMCFNLGIHGLLQFKNMIASLECGNYIQASKNMLNSLWSEQVGERALRLSIRMRKGE